MNAAMTKGVRMWDKRAERKRCGKKARRNLSKKLVRNTDE